MEMRRRSISFLPLVYDQLRAVAQQRMASERAGHTLQATALVRGQESVKNAAESRNASC